MHKNTPLILGGTRGVISTCWKADMNSLPQVSTFSFHDDHQVRVLFENGEPLFHANDLCVILEYANPHDAVRRHVEKDDLVKREVTDKLGRKQNNNFVLEAGMWALMLGSETPKAKEVKKWITSEVLPAIRKTGSYSVTEQKPQPPALLGEIAVWVMAQYVKNLERYISKSGQQISSRLHTYIRARFGVVNVRDIPSPRLDELLNELEQFYQQAYAMWQVCQKLERAWLQTIYKPQYESRFEIPAVIQQEITNNVNDNHGIETMPQVIRKEAIQRLLG